MKVHKTRCLVMIIRLETKLRLSITGYLEGPVSTVYSHHSFMPSLLDIQPWLLVRTNLHHYVGCVCWFLEQLLFAIAVHILYFMLLCARVSIDFFFNGCDGEVYVTSLNCKQRSQNRLPEDKYLTWNFDSSS